MKIESKIKINESQEIASWDPPQDQDYEISSFDQFRYSIKSFLESWNFPYNFIQIITLYLFQFLSNFFNIKKILNSFDL